MSMTVIKRKDSAVARVIVQRIADVRGGVSIATSELNVDYLAEGRPVSAPVDGLSHVVKYARVAAAVTATDVTIKVYKGHDFKVGDVVFAKEGGAAYAITAIDESAADSDTLTIGTTLGVALAKDTDYIFHGASAGAKTGAFKYAPFGIVGTGKQVFPKSNVDTDLYVFAMTRGNELPATIAAKLPHIVNY